MAARKYAVLTMAHEETDALRLWERYYAAEFGAENLFVVDHNSTAFPASSVLQADCNILRMPVANPVMDPDGGKRLFDHARFKFLSSTVEALLYYYDCVILGDADEVIVVDPKAGTGLRDYLDGLDDLAIRAAVGIDVIHNHREEPDYALDKPLFEQRSFFRYNLHFTKPRILSEAVEVTGHGAMGPVTIDPNLLLLHLHWVDRRQKLERQRVRLGAFEAGRGGLKSHWKDDEAETIARFDKFLSYAVSEEDMPHHDFLDIMLPGYREKPLSGKNYTRLKGERHRLIELDKFIERDHLLLVEQELHRFPERFKPLKNP